MLCRVCISMLRGGIGQKWSGSHDLTFEHHIGTETLRSSTEAGCSICIALGDELRSEFGLLDGQPISLTAALSELNGGQWGDGGVYRLDFMLERRRRIRTFILQPTVSHDSPLRTPKSYHTSSDEVLELAHAWIANCTCARSWLPENMPSKRYPKRLIDIHELREANSVKIGQDFTFFSQNSDLGHARVKLVEESDVTLRAQKHNRYVTLSHCWGTPKSAQSQLKLTTSTEKKFKDEGIKLSDFSKTFREAILVACRLERVGYIWIDSLCIKQASSAPGDDPKDAERDWMEQSRVMGDVYRESYLNISATAATDGNKGLFFPREPELLWETEVNVNLAGLPGHYRSIQSSLPTVSLESGNGLLKRCTVMDVAFWEGLVDGAPINKRAWVLQERLLAPRVLHFCANQIAWECAEFDRAEGHPDFYAPCKTMLGQIVRAANFKSLVPEVDGLALRENRLDGFEDPDKNLKNIYVYELWKRIVEVYSTTRLTKSKDKLVALSGIAKLMRNEHLPGVEYVAGMWDQYLESQLLWRVEPLFKDGSFENHATRDPTRAPSFSWAALDVPQGIVYGEATDYSGCDRELLFKVISFDLPYTDDNGRPDRFGLLENENNAGYIELRVKHLHKIRLRKLEPSRRVPYCWWVDEGTSFSALGNTPTEHTNVYLDAPDSDVDIFTGEPDLYCMPAAFGERTVVKTSRYLMCLLLQKLDEEGNFKRIGLTKLSNHANADAQMALLGVGQMREQSIRIR